MSDHFDLVIIGGGPGGYSGALYGASAGLKVALVEKDALGGTCLNRGCIPAKAFLETAAVKRHVDHSSDFGIDSGDAKVNFARTQERKQGIVAGLVNGIGAMCKQREVEVFNGVGSLAAGRAVDVAMNDGSTATITSSPALHSTWKMEKRPCLAPLVTRIFSAVHPLNGRARRSRKASRPSTGP